jgi:hypothetical protein
MALARATLTGFGVPDQRVFELGDWFREKHWADTFGRDELEDEAERVIAFVTEADA